MYVHIPNDPVDLSESIGSLRRRHSDMLSDSCRYCLHTDTFPFAGNPRESCKAIRSVVGISMWSQYTYRHNRLSIYSSGSCRTVSFNYVAQFSILLAVVIMGNHTISLSISYFCIVQKIKISIIIIIIIAFFIR